MNPDKYWCHPKNLLGWKKEQAPTARHQRMIAATDPSLSLYEKYLQAATRARALSDSTTDPETKRAAAEDAEVFFNRARAIARADKRNQGA